MFFLVIIEDYLINSSSIFKYFDELRIFLCDPGVCLTTDVSKEAIPISLCILLCNARIFIFGLNIIRSSN